uniref:Protein aurora borealis n=1 Tax=Timema poppense TaxID=170557 RepID=A0A7R9HIC1_TIMPO|nr:unnamed protein product [Timema poppensis]
MRFFQCHPVVPSPWGEPVPKGYPSRCFEDDENKLKEVDEESERKNNICVAKVNVSSQTVLSLPPVLPREVEEVLKPFFSTGEETEEADDSFMNTSTLRRKLLFHEDMNVSPYLSSVQSGLLRHSPYSQVRF